MVNFSLLLKKNQQKPQLLKVSRDEFLDAKPVRNPSLEWKVDDQGKTLIITVPKEKKEKRFSNFFGVLEAKKFSLDEIGSLVWDMSDGGHSMKDIIERLNERFKLNGEEAETGLQTFVTRLSKKGLIGFVLPSATQTKSRKSLERN
jgi:hypothetical protein